MRIHLLKFLNNNNKLYHCEKVFFQKRNYSSKPFRVLGVQQIAIGGTDKKRLSNLWKCVLGITKKGSYKSVSENVNEDILICGKKDTLGEIEIDLMEPINPNISPKVHIPPLNHIGLWIDHLPKAVEFLTSKGMRFTPGGIRKGAGGHDVIFIHPKSNEKYPLSGEGVLIELVQAPPSLIDEFEK